MHEAPRIRIGSQTSFAAARIAEPFEYAVANGFEAFEWFPDKRPTGEGWLETDLPADARAAIRRTAAEHNISLSVHGSGEATPMTAEGLGRLVAQVSFAAEIGASVFVMHLEAGVSVDGFLESIAPLLGQLAGADIQLALENTPLTPPGDFNELFRQIGARDGVGMCLDVGHANLCPETRHDYLAYVDRLAADVAVSHVHLHENWGDADSHLTLFTGPASRDVSGMEGLVDRLIGRGFAGCVIFEQWPEPPSLLTSARDHLAELIAARCGAGATSADRRRL